MKIVDWRITEADPERWLMRNLTLVVSAVLLVLACGSKLPKLRLQLASSDPDQRIAAVKALAEAEDTVAVPAIVGLLADSVPDVRKEAAKGLGEIGDSRACESLASFYEREPIEDVADAGVRALIAIGPASANPLIELTRSIKWAIRAGAARALGKLKAREAVSQLIRLLDDREDQVRIAAIYALRQIGDPRGLDAIARAVQDLNPQVESAAEGALSGEGYQEELNKAKRLIRRVPYP